ncbi:MAG: hypothetical protein BGO98_06215 [Myxococcales bacterium 68-20]|nr:MAG: hypothetical protein BGO98_06215 [Myxococcales bacterium 68-20]
MADVARRSSARRAASHPSLETLHLGTTGELDQEDAERALPRGHRASNRSTRSTARAGPHASTSIEPLVEHGVRVSNDDVRKTWFSDGASVAHASRRCRDTRITRAARRST